MQIVADHTFGSQVRGWKQMKPRIARHCYNQNLGTDAMSTTYPVTWHHWKLHSIDRELCCFDDFLKMEIRSWCLQHLATSHSYCSLFDLLAFVGWSCLGNQFDCFVAWLGWVEPLCKTTWRTGLQKETIFWLCLARVPLHPWTMVRSCITVDVLCVPRLYQWVCPRVGSSWWFVFFWYFWELKVINGHASWPGLSASRFMAVASPDFAESGWWPPQTTNYHWHCDLITRTCVIQTSNWWSFGVLAVFYTKVSLSPMGCPPSKWHIPVISFWYTTKSTKGEPKKRFFFKCNDLHMRL